MGQLSFWCNKQLLLHCYKQVDVENQTVEEKSNETTHSMPRDVKEHVHSVSKATLSILLNRES